MEAIPFKGPRFRTLICPFGSLKSDPHHKFLIDSSRWTKWWVTTPISPYAWRWKSLQIHQLKGSQHTKAFKSAKRLWYIGLYLSFHSSWPWECVGHRHRGSTWQGQNQRCRSCHVALALGWGSPCSDGGFHSHGGTPIDAWFAMEKAKKKMWFRGTPRKPPVGAVKKWQDKSGYRYQFLAADPLKWLWEPKQSTIIRLGIINPLQMKVQPPTLFTRKSKLSGFGRLPGVECSDSCFGIFSFSVIWTKK